MRTKLTKKTFLKNKLIISYSIISISISRRIYTRCEILLYLFCFIFYISCIVYFFFFAIFCSSLNVAFIQLSSETIISCDNTIAINTTEQVVYYIIIVQRNKKLTSFKKNFVAWRKSTGRNSILLLQEFFFLGF